MAELTNSNNPITANGDFWFPTIPGAQYIVTLGGASGDFDSGQFDIQYDESVDDSGDYQTYPNGSFTARGSLVIKAVRAKTNINVTSVASASNVSINVVKLN